MDNFDSKLDELANDSSGMNPVEMWMRDVISKRQGNEAGHENETEILDGISLDSNLGDISAQDIDHIIGLLDSYNANGGSRMKIDVTEGEGEVISKQYHHGRCDVCSPFANGDAWDVLEDEEPKS